MRPVHWLLVVGLSAGGCSKTSGGDTSTSASGTSSPVSPGSASSTSAATTAPASSNVAATRAWKGAYKSAAASLTVPPDTSKVHWSDTQSAAGIGDGTLTVTIDGASGRVTGEIAGPLGPASVEGLAVDGKVTASVRRKDPTDRGFTGTLVGSIAGERLDGTMSVSLGQASALRGATFSLAAEGAR
jgi:hypothetical protein